MRGLWQRFLQLPRWGQYAIAVSGVLAIFVLVTSGKDGDSNKVTTTTVTVTTPAPAATTSSEKEPAQTLADAHEAVAGDHYEQAITIGAALGQEDVIRRSIANRIARRATAAVRDGDRSRASSLLREADRFPATNALTQARATYRAAKQQAADRARAREAAAELAAAERQAEEEAAAAEPAPEPSGGGCDPNYSGCVPAYPPDVNCPQVDGPVQVTGNDPHGLDRDGDGVACE